MQSLVMAACPACDTPNDLAARFCSACGTPLVMRCAACHVINVRTRVQCHHCGAALHAESAPEDTVPAVFAPAAQTAGLPVTPPAPVTAVLPVLDLAADPTLPDGWVLSLRDAVDEGRPAAAPPADTWPVIVDPDPGPPPAPSAAPAPPAAAAPAPPPDQKARKRASVRREQLRRRRMSAAQAGRLQEALLLESDTASRVGLHQLLEAFGFRTRVAVSVAEAEGLSARHDHVLVLIGLGGQGTGTEAAADLCRRLREATRGAPMAVLAVGAKDAHADRVRMQLAGADAILFRPVSRGDLARAIDACGLALPRDPRAGAPPIE